MWSGGREDPCSIGKVSATCAASGSLKQPAAAGVRERVLEIWIETCWEGEWRRCAPFTRAPQGKPVPRDLLPYGRVLVGLRATVVR